jgi:ATP-dependent RNA helicase MRH4
VFHLATDEEGNRNNVLKLPKSYISKIKDEGRRTSTPVGQVASVAAEVADVAAKLDEVRIRNAIISVLQRGNTLTG